MVDHNALDLDQAAIEKQIGLKTEESFKLARKVYYEGGNSKAYAVLTLEAEPSAVITSGTALEVEGVKGEAYAESSGKTLKFKYPIGETQKDHQLCKVGGLPTDDQVKDKCLPATGNVTYGSTTIKYDYDIDNDNKNGRTLRGFSTAAEKKMWKCDRCPYKEYQKFYDWYGNFDYADRWVTAALDGTKADFAGKPGQVDFAQWGLTGRGECAKKGTAYMNNYMYVIREFEDAIDDCLKQAATDNYDSVIAWDEGVAFYTGSLEGTAYESGTSGKMLHALADKRCKNFNTCGVNGDKADGNSKVNFDLFALYATGLTQLLQQDCLSAEKTKDAIVKKMPIPLVQGTLRYAYKVDKEDGGEKERAEGAVFAAAVVPIVNACNKDDALTIHNNMKVGGQQIDFAAVKKAFENNYQCMGITCDDIGQLTNAGVVKVGAEKCTDTVTSSSSSSNNNGLAIGLGVTAGVVGLVAVVTIMYMAKREKSGNPVFAGEKGALS